MLKNFRKAFSEIKDAILGSRRFFVRAELIGIYSQIIVWELNCKLELVEFGKVVVDREEICTNEEILQKGQEILKKAGVSSYSLRIF